MQAAILILLGLIALILGAVLLARVQFVISERRSALALFAIGLGLILIGAIVAATSSGPAGPAPTPTPTAEVSPTATPSPTASPTPTPTPTPPPTVTPTATPTPTVAPTPTVTATATVTVTAGGLIDVPASIGSSVDQFQIIYGSPFLIAHVSPGQLDAAPNGGEARSYQRDWGVLEGVFQDGTLTGLYMLFERSYPQSFNQALELLDLPANQPPDIDTPTSREWKDLAGFTVIMNAGSANGEVNQITVYKP
jgi:hypothetical protein